MIESVKAKSSSDSDDIAAATSSPQVFVSHDARDAELAEAFGKLVKSVSAGMIRTFRSSDKKGNEGIDFGDEWYERLMAKLQSTSDAVVYSPTARRSCSTQCCARPGFRSRWHT